MKFTATGAFNAYASGSSKVLQWSVYVKDTTVLNEALTAGTWTDVNGYINWDSFPDIVSKIEYEPGQFITDNITLEAKNITWWKANIFTSALLASTTRFLEIKIQLQIGIGGTLATDLAYMFNGWVDKVGIIYNEKMDQVTFQAFTAEDLGSRMAGENISTQYVSPDGGGMGVPGLFLYNITGLFFVNANVAGKVLTVGEHTIGYQVSGVDKQARLDGGAWVTMPTTALTYTLGNGASAALDTQRVQVYVPVLTALPASGTFSDTVVVVTAGTTLPNQWYKNSEAKFILSKIYQQMGIDTVTYDTLQMASYDGTSRGQYLGMPPNDSSVRGNCQAMASNGTDIYIAKGTAQKVYKFVVATGKYTELCDLSSIVLVNKMIYNSRNNELWILYGTSVRKYSFNSSTLSSAVTIAGSFLVDTVQVIDYNYTGSSWKYGVLYNDTVAQDVKFIDGSSLAVSALGTGHGANLAARGTFMKSNLTPTAPYWYQVTNAGNSNWYSISVSAAGAFVLDGIKLSTAPQVQTVVYNASWDRIYYTNSGGISSHTPISTTTFSHVITGGGALLMQDTSTTTNFVYCQTNDGKIWSMSGASVGVTMGNVDGNHIQNAMTYSDRVWGIDSMAKNMLFQCSTDLFFVPPIANFPGISVRDALVKILGAYGLIGIISASKVAYVYRRGNYTGAPQTTGNILSMTVANSEDIEETISSYQPFALVKVTGVSKTTTYDGTNWDVNVLSNKSLLQITSPYIDDNVVRDIAYHIFKFFSLARNTYKIPLPNVTLFQYEPFDAANTTFTTTKIIKSIAGTNTPIYGVKYKKSGSMEVEVIA